MNNPMKMERMVKVLHVLAVIACVLSAAAVVLGIYVLLH